MANNVYIGMRYIPNFRGEYDNTTVYETLDVVDNGLGTSYIAKRSVPAGTALTNTTYWAIYGASSGAVLDLQNRMQTAESDIDAIEANLEDLDVLTDAGNLKGKTIAIFGASNELASYTQNENWTNELADLLDGYATIINKSVAGRTLLQAIDAYIADIDKSTYDIVIFCCTKNLYLNQNILDVGFNINLLRSNIDTKISSLSAYKSITQEIYFATCTPYQEADKSVPMCLYDGVVYRSASANGYKMLDMHSWLGVSDANSGSYTHDSIHFKAEVAPIFAYKALRALVAGGDPVSNYSCKLRGSAVLSYLSQYTDFLSGLSLAPSEGNSSIFYCDLLMTVALVAFLRNDRGSIITANTMIVGTSGSYDNSVFHMPANSIATFENVYGGTQKITNRAFGIRTEVDIPASGTFMIKWGNYDVAAIAL